MNVRTGLTRRRNCCAKFEPGPFGLPIAFATAHLSTEARAYLDSIPRRPLPKEVSFWIPDFPIHEVLPWPPR